MLVISFFFIGTLLLTLQTTLFQILPEWVGKPELLFVLIVFLGVRLDIYKGAVLTLLFGLLMDIFSGIYLGLHPVIYLLLFFALKGVTRHLAIDEYTHIIPLVVLSYLFTCCGIFVFATFLAPENQLEWYWSKTLLQALILSVISIPFFSLYDGLQRLLNRAPARPSLFRQKPANRFRT